MTNEKHQFFLFLEQSHTETDAVDGGTMIQHATLTNNEKSKIVETSGNRSGSHAGSSMLEVDLGTMVINEDNDNTVQRPRPEFLNHFDQQEKEKVVEKSTETGNSINNSASLINKTKPPDYGNAQAIQTQYQPMPGTGNFT